MAGYTKNPTGKEAWEMSFMEALPLWYKRTLRKTKMALTESQQKISGTSSPCFSQEIQVVIPP